MNELSAHQRPEGVLQALLRNPITLYLRFVLERARNQRRYRNFDQGYMSQVTDCEIEPNVRIATRAFVGSSYVGGFSYVGSETYITRTRMGRFCSIGPGSKVGLGKHPTRQFVSTSPAFYSTLGQCGATFVETTTFDEFAPVIIGSDVWIGANVVIPGGITIGHGAIIGAGAVVASDVPDYAIVGGLPARLIRHRFDPDQIAFLLRFAWWNRDDEWVRSNAHLFADIEAFIREIEPRVASGPSTSEARNAANSLST